MDLGSGDGRNIIAAAKRGARRVGVEYNPDMVELSRRHRARGGRRRQGDSSSRATCTRPTSRRRRSWRSSCCREPRQAARQVHGAQARHAHRAATRSPSRAGSQTKPSVSGHLFELVHVDAEHRAGAGGRHMEGDGRGADLHPGPSEGLGHDDHRWQHGVDRRPFARRGIDVQGRRDTYTGRVAGNRISGVAMGASAQNWTATR